MSRGIQLSQLRYKLKGEIGASQSVGTAMDSELNTLLANKQVSLAAEWDWSFLKTRVDTVVAAGQRYVILPNLNYDRPVDVRVLWSTLYQPVLYGIDQREYNIYNSDLGRQIDPIQKWQLIDQAEIDAPGAVTLGSSGVGLTGTYRYGVTFVTAQGETELGTTAVITVVNKQVDLTAIPLGAAVSVQGVNVAVVTARNIYRTTNGGSSYKLVATLADNVTTVYSDIIADAALGVVAPTYSTSEVSIFEVWPVPVTAQTMRFSGQRALNPLVADGDKADLDDMILVLFVAAEKLMMLKQSNAQAKLAAAQARMRMVRAGQPTREVNVVFGRNSEGSNGARTVPITIIAAG